MADQPVFVFLAAYDDIPDAEPAAARAIAPGELRLVRLASCVGSATC